MDDDNENSLSAGPCNPSQINTMDSIRSLILGKTIIPQPVVFHCNGEKKKKQNDEISRAIAAKE